MNKALCILFFLLCVFGFLYPAACAACPDASWVCTPLGVMCALGWAVYNHA